MFHHPPHKGMFKRDLGADPVLEGQLHCAKLILHHLDRPLGCAVGRRFPRGTLLGDGGAISLGVDGLAQVLNTRFRNACFNSCSSEQSTNGRFSVRAIGVMSQTYLSDEAPKSFDNREIRSLHVNHHGEVEPEGLDVDNEERDNSVGHRISQESVVGRDMRQTSGILRSAMVQIGFLTRGAVRAARTWRETSDHVLLKFGRRHLAGGILMA